MALLSILDRFRPVGAPGPGAAGVPAAADHGPAEELAPVLAEMSDHLARCRALVAVAEEDARVLVQEARDRSGALLARARADADAGRARAAARVQQRAAAEDERRSSEAEARAQAVVAAGAEQIPVLVRTVLDDLVDRTSGG